MSIGSHDESANMEFKFSDESLLLTKLRLILKRQTKRHKVLSTDDNSDARNDAENLDKNIENKTVLPENSAKENNENGG